MLIDPTLTTRPPQLGAQHAEALVRTHYGRILEAHELGGERDRNFRMVAPDGSQFLLKISNPAEAVDIVHLQNAVLNHLRDRAPSLPVPRLVASVEGTYETRSCWMTAALPSCGCSPSCRVRRLSNRPAPPASARRWAGAWPG